MKLETMASIIARTANKCCNRSDGYEEAIKALAEGYLIEAWNDAIAEAHKIASETTPYADEILKLKLKK